MGLTGELVKNVFSRSRSAAAHEGINVQGRRRWSSVRSYLCGDEFNSVAAEEDSASVKSSEATVVQPLPSGLAEEDKDVEFFVEEKNNSMSSLFHEEEDAAIVIQTAFRRFLARRREDHEERGSGSVEEKGSISTSIEVQTADSMKAFSVMDEAVVGNDNHRAKHRSRTQQLLRTKDDWDDSTVSSNISKKRVQHRLEAMTRRERALAYAFSQQLRICSKKRPVQTDGTGPDVGWSWLERWMATRVPDKYKDIEQQLGPMVVRERLLDIAREEKESCGSNSVSVHLDSVSVNATEEREIIYNNTNNIPIPTNRRSSLRRKSATKRQCQRVHAQITKKDSTEEAALHKRNKQEQLESKEQNQCPDNESENPASTEHVA